MPAWKLNNSVGNFKQIYIGNFTKHHLRRYDERFYFA